MRMNKKFFAIMMAMMLVFTSIPMVSFGVSKPKTVTIGGAELIDDSTLIITLDKAKKCDGYALFSIDSSGNEEKVLTKKYKDVKKHKTIKYNIRETDKFIASVTSSAKNGKYIYRLRSYNTYKQKQYYNPKTKKWVTKKPAKKKWKSKKKTAYKYSNDSASNYMSFEIKKEDTKEEDNGDTPAEGGDSGGGGSGGGGGGGSTPVDVGDKEEIVPIATCKGIAIASGLTYTGSALDLLSSPGTATGGTLMYYVTTSSTTSTAPAKENFKSDSSAYKRIDPGTYYVWYYVKGDENHTDSEKMMLGPIIIKSAKEENVPDYQLPER